MKLLTSASAAEHVEYWRYQYPAPESFVYVIKAQGDAPIKVGKGDTNLDRLGAIQTGNPRRLVLLNVLVGGLDLEWQLHHKLKGCRMVGEWFAGEAVPEFLKFTDQLAADMLSFHETSKVLPNWENFHDGWQTRRRSSPRPIRPRRPRLKTIG